MISDCAILGGGPAGLNAALVLGRARRTVLVFDDHQPRNAATQESHGFLTRDGVKPDEFRMNQMRIGKAGKRCVNKYSKTAFPDCKK